MKRVALVISLALVACSPKPNLPDLTNATIVLIVVDTVGANQVGPSDRDESATPRIDRLAAGGVSFSRAYSPAPWTQPAVASVFTSLMPSEHGVGRIRDVLAPEFDTLAERLRTLGYSTTGIVSHSLLSAELGYSQGFDRYDESSVGGHRAITSERVTDLAIEALRRSSDAPQFLFVHYFDPHFYYHHHPSFDRTSSYSGRLTDIEEIWEIRGMRSTLSSQEIDFLVGRHREEIAYTDHEIGRLLDAIDELGIGKHTIVALLGDHGEEFMEHGWLGHTRTLYDELIRVPLIVRLPGDHEALLVEQPVSTLDVLPTLLELVGVSADGEAFAGRLLPLDSNAEGEARSRPIFSEVAFIPPGQLQNEKLAVKSSLIQGDMKVIHDRLSDAWEFYDLGRDPRESTNLAADGAARFRELSRKLLARESNLPHPTTDSREDWGLSPEDLERLKSLGYVE